MSGSVAVHPSEGPFPSAPRLWTFFVVSLVAISVLAGTAVTLQAAWGLSKFGGLEYAPRVTTLSALRELAPGAGPSAAVIAMVAWAHRVGAGIVGLRLRELIARCLLASLAAFPIAAAVSITSSLALLRLYGVSADQFWQAALGTVQVTDLAAGFGFTALDAAFVFTSAWFALIPFARTSLNLAAKILIALLLLGSIRLLLGGVVAFAA